MDTVAIFGAGVMGRAIHALLKKDANVLCFFDNAAPGTAEFDGVPVVPFGGNADFDRIYIAVMNEDAFVGIRGQLLRAGVPPMKIRSYKEVLLYRARIEFLRGYAEQIRGGGGANAEVGCFRGEFAKEINAAFPDDTLYLFDTFEGFADADMDADTAERSVVAAFSKEFSQTSVQLVMDKMPFPENVIVKRGYFPGTFDIHDERFGFVSVDADLYAPVKAALDLFFPRMIDRGVLLVHDYYNDMLPGVRKAVDEFSARNSALLFPIGDAMSIGIMRQKNENME